MKADVPVFIVDDDPAVREGLSALLAAKRYKVETYASATEFLAALGPEPVGCLIADIRMSGMSGMELQRELTRRGLPIPTVIITGHGDVPLAVAALKAGAVDFLEKPFDSDALLASVAEAMRRLGKDKAQGFSRADIAARAETLSVREREVMDLVVAGQPNKVIAHRLGIAIRTVEIHRARVMEKLGARNLSELVRMAILLESAP